MFYVSFEAQKDRHYHKIYMKPITLSLICICTFAISAAAQETNADNSATNKRDRSGETQTSGDQSNTKEDTNLTAAIRRAVVKDSSLSSTAKNIKIITGTNSYFAWSRKHRG